MALLAILSLRTYIKIKWNLKFLVCWCLILLGIPFLRRQVMTGRSTQEFRWSLGVKVSWYLLADRNDGQGQGAFADIANRKVPKLNIVNERARRDSKDVRGNGSGIFLSVYRLF